MASGQTPEVDDWQDVEDWKDVASGDTGQKDSALSRGLTRFGQAINPLPMLKAIIGPGEDVTSNIQENIVKPAIGQSSENLTAARKAIKEGKIGEGLKYYAQAAPVIGPQIQSVLSDVYSGNVAGAVGTGAGLALPFAAGKLAKASGLSNVLNKSAEVQYERVLNPTKIKTKVYAQEAVPELIKRGQWAGTFDRLNAQFGAERANALIKLDEVWSKQLAGKTVDKAPLLKAMDDAIAEWKTEGETTLPTGQKVKTAVEPRPEINSALRGVRNLLDQYADQVPVETLRKTRQMWDSVVGKAGGYASEDLINQAKLYARREGATTIRNELSKVTPDLSAANKEVSFWLRVEDIMDATQLRRTGQATPISEKILASGGLAHAGITGGLAMATAAKLFRSTGYRTLSAISKNRLANLISSGKITEANAFMTTLVNSLPKEDE